MRNPDYWVGVLCGVLLLLLVQTLWDTGDPDLRQYRRVRDFVRESFVGEVDDQELLDHALHGMLSSLDAYSRYYDRGEARSLERETLGRYQGIGVLMKAPARDGQVLFALPGSPAARAGLRVGDRFVTVGGRAVAELDAEELQAELREPPSGVVEARVVGLDGSERDVVMHPESVVDPTVRHTRMVDPERGVGYVSIHSFSRETPGEFDRSFEFLRAQGMRALVLDLRRNYGGILSSAVEIARRFVSSGLIVSTEGRGRPERFEAVASEALYHGFPLVVLVDGDSASASEVLAGALQDHRAAVVVGTPTYGKGMVQTIRRFDDGSTVAKVTSAYYYSPTHRNFERSAVPDRDHGILPDVEVPISELEQRVVHAYLERYGPPVEAIPAIEAWSAWEGRPLVEPHPPDAQLDAALELFAGRRPGPHPLAEAE